MFVQTNSVKAIRAYFKEKLSNQFSESEIKLIGNEVICSRLNFSAADLISANEKLLSESDLLFFRSVVKRLLENEPFQYVVGNAHFYGLILKSDKRALIPRPETEELIDWIKESYSKEKPLNIADVCTGSGCIALSLKSIFREANVVATDFSKEALSLANENSIDLSLDIDMIEFDATIEAHYEKISLLDGQKYDCWVSNPPYIPNEESLLMSENVLKFEPHAALFVPDVDPLLFYRVISKMANFYLKKSGLLFFEIHENFANDVVQLLESLNFINVELKEDLQGKSRMVKAEKL